MDTYNDPFHFAVARGASKESRERVPGHIRATFGVSGRIEHVRSEPGFHLYKIVGGAR